MAEFESSRAVFFKADGTPVKAREQLKQPDLARTYRAIGEHGSKWFYSGPFADALDKWMRENGGIMRKADLESYRIALREPILTSYRGYQLVAFPPPSSGGVHVVQILNILERFDVEHLDPVTRLHVLAEAMKLAFADRAYWLGDPDFVKVPRGLVDKQYAAELARRIDLHHSSKVETHGIPPSSDENVFKKHTTHFSVADEQGNWVACTATINTSFGSKVVIPGTGVVMNNQMDDFSAQPGAANFFGLIGAEANAVAGGKRPLSSMSPTIVLKQGEPIIALGAAGGPKIISDVVQELVFMLDLGMGPKEALRQPRIHHQWSPDELVVERTLSPRIRDGLVRLGHNVRESRSSGISQIVARKGKTEFEGAADPREDGNAAGW
jgi:gamma-glutamyltranspeptidase/glutathione hydrolase